MILGISEIDKTVDKTVDEPSGFQLFIEQHSLWNNCDRSIVFKEIAWQDYLNRENKK